MSDQALLVVGIGDIKVGKGDVVIRTSLGSCIGVCLYNGHMKVGGMLHCMLPHCAEAKEKPGYRPAKYADSGIEELLNDLKRDYGLEPKQLCAKIFGGANMLKSISMKIGQNNEESVIATLKKFGIPVVAFKTGGEKGYQIDFDVNKGSVLCRVFGHEPEEF